MKTRITISIILLFMIGVIFVSCSKETQTIDDFDTDQIVGSYTGTFSIDGLKSGTDAHADVEMNNDSTISVHCYGDEIDISFMLEFFENNDSIMVCLTGDDFFMEYGHQSGHTGNMGNNMMGGSGHMDSNSTEWEHHMEDSHEDGDLHFGGFDKTNHSFSCSFRDPSDNNLLIHFNGTKDNSK